MEKKKKKSNKHKLPPLLDSAVVREMLFKRDTWSIFPFHLVALSPPPLSPLWIRDVRAFLPLASDPPSWERERSVNTEKGV